MNDSITFTQIKSSIGSPESIRATLKGLGLTHLYKKQTRKNTPEIKGMLHKVKHLVKIED